MSQKTNPEKKISRSDKRSSEKSEKAPAEIRKIVLPGQTPEGQYILSVLIKRTYDIVPDSACVRAEADEKLVSGDVHFDGPMNSSVKYESDFVPFKLATDMVFNGNAHAPDDKPVRELSASIRVGQMESEIRVIGDRFCDYNGSGPPVFSDPKPFTTMPMRYENAYGGVDIHSDPSMACVYPRNHLGKGFVIGKEKKQLQGLALPNLEDPENLITPERLCTAHFMHWEKQPMPKSFGWFAKFWRPRAQLAGVLPADRGFEEQLREAYSRMIPEDQRKLFEQTRLPEMDFRFFNGASEGLIVPFLEGGEEIVLVNLCPVPELAFRLPENTPRIGLDIGKGIQEPEVVLHTVMIRMKKNQLDLVWRGAVSYPGPDWLPEMKKMDVTVE